MSDGTLPISTGLSLQPHDKIRYNWRGRLYLEIYQLQAAMAATIDPTVTSQTERIEIKSEKLTANVF